MTKQLTVVQILEIENLSMHGCGIETIACHLGLTPVAFHDLADEDERIREAMLRGRHRGIAAVAKSLFGSATSGKDGGAAKFWLERLAGGDWRPPRANQVLVVEMPPPNPALSAERVAEMDRRFARQHLLVQGCDIDPDGRIIDLDAPAKVPSPDAAGDGGV